MRFFIQTKARLCEAITRTARRLFTAAALIVSLATAHAHALDPTRSISQFHHTAWNLRDGMPGFIRAITQTSDGFLWLGTDAGLYRFDGVRVEHIDHFGPTRLPLVNIQSLVGTPNGDLWIAFGGLEATVSRVRRGAVTTFTQNDGLPVGGLVELVADAAGGVWVRTFHPLLPDEVARFDGVSWRVVEGDFGSRTLDPTRGIIDMSAAADGTLWVKQPTGLQHYRPGMERFESTAGFAGGIMGLADAPDGQVWTADETSQRFYALPAMPQQPATRMPPPTLRAPVPTAYRGSVQMMDRDGTLWCLNGQAGGLSRVRSALTATASLSEDYTETQGLTSNGALSIFEDREGNIWVGTIAGLDRFRPADIVLEPGIPLNKTIRLVTATYDAVYVYTGPITAATNANASFIYRIGIDGEPRIAAANVGEVRRTSNRGNDLVYFGRDPTITKLYTAYKLHGLDGPQLRVFPPNFPPFEEHAGVEEFDDGTIWFARPGIGYFRFRDGRETKIFAKEGPRGPLAYTNMHGKRWVYYADGSLFEIDGDQVREHPAPDLGVMVSSDANDQRMVFGGQLGLLEWNGQAFRTLPASRVPALSGIARITLTDKGELWILTQAGILRTSLGELDRVIADPSASLQYRLFDFRDGLPGATAGNTTSGSIAKGPDGRLWFTTASGVTWIDPNRLAHNDLPPPVVVTALTTDDKSFDMPTDLHLPPASSNLRIDYTALSFTIPERNQIRYKLEGIDANWVDAGDRRQAFYTRLEPGTYSFRVIAANNDGVWNVEGATLSFTIAPTFLQSIWFKFLVALAVAVVAWLVYALRLRQQAERLQGRFDVRIAERERIARELHDTLLQSTQGLIFRFQAIANRVPKDSELRVSIDTAIDSADAVVAEGRSRVHELRSEQASENLAQSIIDIASVIVQDETPCFSLTVEGAPRRLHAVVGEEVLRIAEEAVRNATKHANAKTIVAVLNYGRSELRLAIRDDGVGLPAPVLSDGEKAGHFGLIGMRERAQRIDARFDIKSREGFGTEIIVAVRAGAAYKGGQFQLFKRRRLSLPGAVER